MEEKKVVVVTGGNRGLGKATCELFLERGYRVATFARTPTTWHEEDEDFISFCCDIRDRVKLRDTRNKILAKFGRIDALVNNVGVQGEWRKNIDVLPDENWDWNVDVNMTGTFNVTKIIGSELLKNENGGAIVNIASMGGLCGMYGGTVAYCSTKRGITMITECTALEWGPKNVRCNCVCPGPIETEINRSRYAMPGVREGRANLTALKRSGEPRDVAEAVYFLCSDRAKWITGVTIPVDGGITKTTLTPFVDLS